MPYTFDADEEDRKYLRSEARRSKFFKVIWTLAWFVATIIVVGTLVLIVLYSYNW